MHAGAETLQSLLRKAVRRQDVCVIDTAVGGAIYAKLLYTHGVATPNGCNGKKYVCQSIRTNNLGRKFTELRSLRGSELQDEIKNKDVLYLNFDHVLDAMRGDERNRRVVDDMRSPIL